MEWMINSGRLPKHLKKVTSNPPLFSGCEIAKATKKPLRVKGQRRSIMEATYCGECVSVDHLATTPGFVAQLKGWLTRKKYHYSTVFVDH